MRARMRGITCCAPHVPFAERTERAPGTTRSGGPAQQAVQVPWASDVTGDFPARVAGELHTLACVGNPSKASAVCDAQGDDKAARIARRKGRTGKLSTAALAVQEKKKSLAPSTQPDVWA